MKQHVSRLVVITLLAVSTTACATTINKVLADPARYRSRDVQLSGSVTESLSLGSRGAYRIEDNTGQLWVVSDRGTPRRGARVKVKGRVQEAFNFGSFGDRINLPGIGSGIVLMETSHEAR